MPFVTCPGCGSESIAPKELLGLDWRCPKCSTFFTVTDEDDAPAIPRRRRRKGTPIGVWLALGLAVMAVMAVFAAMAKVSREREVAKGGGTRQEKQREQPIEAERKERDERSSRQTQWTIAAVISAGVGLAMIVGPVVILSRQQNKPSDQFQTALTWGCIGCGAMSLVGILLSQHAPVFGGLLEKALTEPWSEGRMTLIPAHAIAFGIVGLVVGGAAGALKASSEKRPH